MFLEGQINWIVVLGVLAVAGNLVAVIAIWFAVANRVRHTTASTELDLVQRVADASDRRLMQTLNAIPVALVETDNQGKFVFANRAAHQLLGRKDAELLGLRFHSATWGITYPDGRPIPPELLPSARALRGQTVRGFHHLMANPSSRRRMTVSVTAMPIEDELGRVIGSTAAIVETDGLAHPEIYAPDRAPEPEAPVAPSAPAEPRDELTRRVFEAASSALVVLGTDGRVREANQTARLLVGRSQIEVGADFADLFLGEDARVEGRQSLRAALAAPAGEAEPILARGAGGASDVWWNILPLADAEGRIDALLLAGESAGPDAEASVETPLVEIATPETDVADQVEARARELAADAEARAAEAAAILSAERDAATARAEQALADAERARIAAREAEADAEARLAGGRRMENVGRLTGGLAHDFNALLGVMTSALDMMLRQADDPSRVRRLGQAALAAGQRGETLVRRLTAFSQGDDAPALQVLDAGVLLKALEGRLRAKAGPGVDLMVEASAEPALARLDPVAFDGAVDALAANAIEAVNGEGSVAVRLELLLEGGLRLSVRDSGPGMDRDLATRALEPFFTTKSGAAGLGLSQAYAFARQSGGVLSIDSVPGEGAEVAITLPAAG